MGAAQVATAQTEWEALREYGGPSMLEQVVECGMRCGQAEASRSQAVESIPAEASQVAASGHREVCLAPSGGGFAPLPHYLAAHLALCDAQCGELVDTHCGPPEPERIDEAASHAARKESKTTTHVRHRGKSKASTVYTLSSGESISSGSSAPDRADDERGVATSGESWRSKKLDYVEQAPVLGGGDGDLLSLAAPLEAEIHVDGEPELLGLTSEVTSVASAAPPPDLDSDIVANPSRNFEILMQMGHSKLQQGQADGAIRVFKQAAPLLKSIAATHYQVEYFNSLGVAYWKKKDALGALSYFQEARRCGNRLQTMDMARILLNIGLAQAELGNLAEAHATFATARQLRRESGMLDTYSAAVLQRYIGDILLKQGMLQAAFDSYSAATQVLSQLNMMEDALGVALLLRTGIVRQRQGDLLSALQAYSSAWCLVCRNSGKESAVAAKLQEQIGIAKRERGDLTGACDAFDTALDIRTTLGEQENPEHAVLLVNSAVTLRLLGEHEAAVDHFDMAYRIRRSTQQKMLHQDVHLLTHIGLGALAMGNKDWAAECLLEAMQLRTVLGTPQTDESRLLFKAVGCQVAPYLGIGDLRENPVKEET